jgi:AraC-like DNA-binding protein
MWRAAGVLCMAGHTDRYAVAPRGEYVFGIVAAAPMLSRRGRQRRLVQPGSLLAWDPSQPHAGAAVDGPWTSQLIIVETADLATLANDTESAPLTDVAFPEAVLSDRGLTRDFLLMHATLEAPATRLERELRLAQWLRLVAERHSAALPTRAPLTRRDDRALRLAGDYLAEHYIRNIGLDELAAVAGVGKFRLIQLFRESTGLPPHALLIAHRVRHARRLLETGTPIAAVAAATGFADQSHLHRHFQRSLGMSPGAYRRQLQT